METWLDFCSPKSPMITDLHFSSHSDDPGRDEKIKGDPHRTVFIARLVSNYELQTNTH